MFSIEQFKQQYEVEQTTFSVGNHRLKLFVPRKIDAFINPDDLFNNFPLWSKIWEATAVLASHISTIKVNSAHRFLEIGAGMGVAGLSCAGMGHAITITEYNEDALNFARANAILNNMEPDIVAKLDWNQPMVQGQFDYIIGSEVVFKETDFPGLYFLFQKYLKPDGKIILAEGMRKTSLKFIQEMEKHYQIRMKKQTIGPKEKAVSVVLMEMKEK
ncbi:Lysine methyltransferase [Desulfocicer vacuolatum DSM 3385]|uniref:Lysine methyltransferase n=1 Tax=Desulfocicer vacuolatum DSM 3385 TaxID=1121400 RepID=A0A1W2E1J1_9BACT|nr:protein N-lysine methyltransferase family protein [Desulfocicer vacuolatum]SMD03585.1 Lysine methyltransferase [Desulfocicer vacuolatum DSM 3385]